MTEKFQRKEREEVKRKKNLVDGLAKWHGQTRKASEQIGNTKGKTRSRSMIVNAVLHGT